MSRAEPSARAEIKVLDDPGLEAATVLARHAAAGHHIALTGGSTPRRAYQRVAGMRINWSATTLWWGDERCVPPWDERSNFRMAREALLDRIAQLPDVHRIRGELREQRGNLARRVVDDADLDVRHRPPPARASAPSPPGSR